MDSSVAKIVLTTSLNDVLSRRGVAEIDARRRGGSVGAMEEHGGGGPFYLGAAGLGFGQNGT